jgi:small GTP-binding protein
VYDEKGWKYFIISGPINEDKNETIKTILTEHIKSEELIKVKDEIQKMKKDIEKKNSSELLNLRKIISQKLSQNRKFYDVLIVIVDKLTSENSKTTFEAFQNYSEKKSEQPFILYLCKNEKNPNIDRLYQSVNNNNINIDFDKRNLSVLTFPQTNDDFKCFNNYLMKCLYYYHEKGTLTNDKEISHSFNILVCGPAGAGKSTFINQFLQEKQAKDGEGLSVTQEIVKYYHKEYPITIFDTPGFEDESTVAMVSAIIDKLKENIDNSKDHLDLIIYYCKLEKRTFLNMEIKLIKKLCKDKRIIFVVNTFGKTEKGKETQKSLKDKKDSLRQILKGEKQEIIESIVGNMILVNQISSFDEGDEEDEEPRLKKAYGMDSLFKKLYDIFKKEKIVINEIENSKNVKEMKDNIKKYNLLSHINNIEDIIINRKILASRKILSYSRYDFFVFFFIDSRRKELLSYLRELYGDKSGKNIDSLFSEIYNKAENLTGEEKEKEKTEFFESIKRFKDMLENEGFDFNVWFYNQFTLLMGYIFIKDYEKEFGLYDDNSKHFIRELSLNINKGIDGFKALSEEWEEIYKELKEGKIKRDWVKNFFLFKTKKE